MSFPCRSRWSRGRLRPSGCRHRRCCRRPRGSPPAVGTILDPGAPSEVLFLHDLALTPAARGLRIGEQLVAAALEAARRDGLTEAELV
ncbi:MAG TPA: hypothetical protein DEP91_09430, partial [Sphingomonas bacterium]|nr:hypothetical protein [Sphingomonas bacterium]